MTNCLMMIRFVFFSSRYFTVFKSPKSVVLFNHLINSTSLSRNTFAPSISLMNMEVNDVVWAHSYCFCLRSNTFSIVKHHNMIHYSWLPLLYKTL